MGNNEISTKAVAESMPSRLTLTKTEAEILGHRLSFLEDEDNAADVFEESCHAPVEVANSAERMLAVLDAGGFTIELLGPVDLAVLEDCIDGCTHLDGAREEFEHGSLSRQKLTAFQNAFYSLKAKIDTLLGA